MQSKPQYRPYCNACGSQNGNPEASEFPGYHFCPEPRCGTNKKCIKDLMPWLDIHMKDPNIRECTEQYINMMIERLVESKKDEKLQKLSDDSLEVLRRILCHASKDFDFWNVIKDLVDTETLTITEDCVKEIIEGIKTGIERKTDDFIIKLFIELSKSYDGKKLENVISIFTIITVIVEYGVTF